jgi:hypothetical protein
MVGVAGLYIPQKKEKVNRSFMKSAFIYHTGLSGFAGWQEGSKLLANHLIKRKSSTRNGSNFGSLSAIISQVHRNPGSSADIKDYLDTFPKGPVGMPGTSSVLSDLKKRYPRKFGLTAKPQRKSKASGAGSSAASASLASKKSGFNWATGGLLVAAGLGVALMFGDKKSEPQKTEK